VLFTIRPKLTNESLRLTVRPRTRLDTRFTELLLTLAAQKNHLTALGTRGTRPVSLIRSPLEIVPTQLVAKAKLNSLIAIAILGANLKNRTRTNLQDRHRNGRAVLSDDRRHPDFSSEQSNRHWNLRGANRNGAATVSVVVTQASTANRPPEAMKFTATAPLQQHSVAMISVQEG
jgi:hypothetical protein